MVILDSLGICVPKTPLLMNFQTLERKDIVFQTPWFDLVAKSYRGESHPHYSISTKDYVCVVATEEGGGLLLIEQFRPALDRLVIELPSGHVEEGETPEQAARKELLEETGFIAGEMIPLGSLSSDPGRLANRMWCFFAPKATPAPTESFTSEPGIELMVFQKGLRELLLSEPRFCSGLNYAAVMLAVLKGYITL